MLDFKAYDVYSTLIQLSTLKQIMDILEFMTNCNQMLFWLTQMIFDNAGPDPMTCKRKQVMLRKNKVIQ